MGNIPFYKKLSLKSKLLILFVTAVVIPLLVIISITIKMLSNQIVKQSTLIYQRSVQQTASNLKEMLIQYVAISNRYTFDETLKKYLDVNRCYTDETEILNIYEDYLNPIKFHNKFSIPTNTDLKIYFLNPTLIQDYDTYVFADEAVQSEMQFVAGKTADGKLAWGMNGDNIFLSRMSKYYNDSNNFFIVTLHINKEKLYSLINQEIETGTTITISDENGEIITTNNTNPSGKPITQEAYYDQLISSTENNFTGNDKTKYKIISIPLGIYDNKNLPDWRVSALIPVDIMLTDEKKIKKVAYIICLMCFVVSSILFVMFIRKITNRIKKLTVKMKGIDGKEFSIIEDDGNQDEVGLVTRIFNGMVINLHKLIYENYETNLNLKEMALKKREAELYALQSQIHPHFLFNTLESLRMGLVDNNDDENAGLVENLSDLLRKSLSWSGEIVTISDEIEFSKAYLEIQSFRFVDKIHYKIDIPDELRNYKIPKLTVQPVVENAVLHGAEPKWDSCTICISASEEDQSILIKVSDDGIGIDNKRLEAIKHDLSFGSDIKKGSSIGLRNVNDRIHLKYGDGYGLNIISTPGIGTTVTIKIPYLK